MFGKKNKLEERRGRGGKGGYSKLANSMGPAGGGRNQLEGEESKANTSRYLNIRELGRVKSLQMFFPMSYNQTKDF